MNNKVSIIVPVYNAENVIGRCLENLLAQTYKNFEVICVNDGSKDNSIDVLKQYAMKDERIIVFSQDNKGPAYTRNFAISKATGDYLMFCDADDWYETTMVEEMVNALEQNNVDIAMCDCNIVDLANGKLQNVEQNVYHKLLLSNKHEINVETVEKINTVLWNKIFRMDILKEYNINYPTKYEHDDSIFFLKYMVIAKTYYGINKILYNYVVGNVNSIMGNVYSKKRTGRQFDFLYAFIDLFEYCDKYASQEYIKFIKNKLLGQWEYFRKYLNEEDFNQAFSILKNIVEKTKIFNNDTSDEIQIIRKSKSYKQYIKNIESSQINIWQKIFSIKNDHRNHKVIRLLGLKLKFKKSDKRTRK